MRFRARRAATVVAALVGAACAAAVLSPTGRYLVRAAWAEAHILARRRPIAEVIADPATPPAIRAKLRVVLDARRFAADSLGLRAGRSFTTFARLDHDTLVLVLSGAYRDRLKPLTWWFPIVGRVPYKGYFDFAAAVRDAGALQSAGFDTYVRPAAAFSTLGWFNDPVVSTTLRADTLDLANTVIHELTHNTFYAPGHADFNESFANFVGARGAAAFFRSRGDSAAAATEAARWADEKVLGDFWTWVYNTLDSAFRRHPGDRPADRAARLAARDTVFAMARDSLASSVPQRLRTIPAWALSRVRLDNAVLLARRVYLTDLDDFDAVYTRCGGDVRRAVRQIIAIARANRRDPFGGLHAWTRDAGTACTGAAGRESQQDKGPPGTA
jgi:predicted aminopeptidase